MAPSSGVMEKSSSVIVVGAGLAGLSCCYYLNLAGISAILIEKESHIGGRVSSEQIDGYTFDRGFQVLTTSYPEAQRILDFAALQLARFPSGAHSLDAQNSVVSVFDPIREPLCFIKSLRTSPLRLKDYIELFKIKFDLQQAVPGQTTEEFLRLFSSRAVRSFLRPFLRGILLERSLETHAIKSQTALKHFARGSAALPKDGMQAIPDQIKNKLTNTKILLNTEVTSVKHDSVTFMGGETLTARQVIVAAPHGLISAASHDPCLWHSVANLYYSTKSRLDKSIILFSDENSTICSIANLSGVQESYAPRGVTLLSISCLIDHPLSESELQTVTEKVGSELRSLYPSSQFSPLKNYLINRALPKQGKTFRNQAVRVENGVFFIGDTCAEASIDGALRSGRLAAERVVQLSSV